MESHYPFEKELILPKKGSSDLLALAWDEIDDPWVGP